LARLVPAAKINAAEIRAALPSRKYHRCCMRCTSSLSLKRPAGPSETNSRLAFEIVKLELHFLFILRNIRPNRTLIPYKLRGGYCVAGEVFAF